jgi:hypothetical protein
VNKFFSFLKVTVIIHPMSVLKPTYFENLLNGLVTDDILGFHGTSVEAVTKLYETGKLPNTGISPGRFSLLSPCHTNEIDWEWYAQQIAVRHFLANELPFEISHQHIVAAQGLVDVDLVQFRLGEHMRFYNEFMEMAKKYNLSKNDIMDLVAKGYLERRGCLLTMSNKMEKDFMRNVEYDSEISFITPGGVGIEYVTGIQPLGLHEWEKTYELIGEPVF